MLEFDVSVNRDGTARSSRGGIEIAADDAWLAEHLVLAGLVRCMLASLAHAANRADLDIRAEGSAHGMVTKRDEDGRYAFVDVEARFDVEVSPSPAPDVLADLLARAERGCFVGNSLASRPRYRWTVDGIDVP